MKQHRNATSHGVTLASGRPLAPGDDGPADPKNQHDAALIEDGQLIPVDDKKEQTK